MKIVIIGGGTSGLVTAATMQNYWKDKVEIVSIQTFVPPTQNKKDYMDFYPEDNNPAISG